MRQYRFYTVLNAIHNKQVTTNYIDFLRGLKSFYNFNSDQIIELKVAWFSVNK